jgi:hypothetical protein
MAVEEVVRLKATVLTDQALADLRALGREIGMLPQRAGRGIKEVDNQFKALTTTLQSLGTGLRAAVPGFGAFSLGAAGVGLVAGQVVRGLGDISKGIVELHHTSRQLGMTTQQVQGFANAAEKAGIAPQSMIEGLKNFRQNTEDFALRVGALREQMMEVGFGPVMQRIMAATTQVDKLKVAYDMAETLGRNSAAAKRLFDMLGIGADKLRISFEDARKEIDKAPLLSDKEIANAQKYNNLMVDIDRSWQNFKQREALRFFDKIDEDKANIQSLIDKAKELHGWLVGAPGATSQRTRGAYPQAPEQFGPPAPAAPGAGLFDLRPGQGGARTQGLRRYQHGGYVPETGPALLHAGETVVPAGGDLLEGSDDTLTKTTKEGTFQGLVQYAAYASAGGAMQGLGGLPGMAGGGGFGGGGATGGWGGGGGQAPGATPAPSGSGGGDRQSSPAPSGGETPSPGGGMSMSDPDQKDRPGHYTGTVELAGKTFHYGTGGQGRGSMPIGTHAINIGKGDIGDIGKRIGSIATVGKLGGNIWDPKIKAMRGGMQIHGGFSDKLEYLKSKGCFAVKPSEWPAFKKALIEENKRTPGGLQLTIGKDGKAVISARSDAPGGSRQVAAGAARPDQSPKGPPAPTERVDGANDAVSQPPGANGQVSVDITSTGTAAQPAPQEQGLFAESSVRNTQQMQRTEDAGAGAGTGP